MFKGHGIRQTFKRIRFFLIIENKMDDSPDLGEGYCFFLLVVVASDDEFVVGWIDCHNSMANFDALVVLIDDDVASHQSVVFFAELNGDEA